MKIGKRLSAVLIAVIMLIGVLPIVANATEMIAGQNDTSRTATPISVNSTYTDNLVTSSDVDYFRFTINKNGYVSIDFRHEPFGSGDLTYWDVYLLNADLEKLTFKGIRGDYALTSTAQIGLSAGTYYIKIEKYRFRSDEYSIKVNFTASNVWETEFNDSTARANSVLVNTIYYGSLRSNDDVDYYKFNTTTDGYISLDFRHEPFGSSDLTYWEVYLLNADLEELTYKGIRGDYALTSTAQIGLSAGTYYLKIKKNYYRSDEYSIKVNFTASNVWETEFNDSKAKANSVLLNTLYYGSIRSNDDVDYYKFNTTKNGNINIDFRHEPFGSSDLTYWEVHLLNADLKELTYKKIRGDYELTSTEQISLSAGTYYIKLNSSRYCGDKYSIKVNAPNEAMSYFVIHYHLSDSAAASSTTTKVTYGTSTATKTISQLGFSKTGYTFAGWRAYREVDGKWLVKNANGNTTWVKLSNGSLPSGYSYYLYKNGQSVAKTAPSGKVHLYAQWKAASFTVYYHSSDSAAASSVTTKVNYGTTTVTKTISQLGFSKAGYTFAGWRAYREVDGKWLVKNANGNTTWVKLSNGSLPSGYSYYLYKNGQSVAKTAPSGKVHFYAQWREASFTIYYHSSEGSSPSGTTTKVPYGTSTATKTVSQLGFSKSGYTFAGWRAYREVDGKWCADNTNGAACWVKLTNGAMPSGYTYHLYKNGTNVAKTATSGNVHFYAQWKKTSSSATLSYNANGGSGAPSSQSGGTSYTVSPTVPLRFGYNFLGWSTSSTASSPSYYAGNKISISQNTTLYAVWKQTTLSVGSSATAKIERGGQIYYFKFKPSTSGYYTFSSSGSADTYGYLYNSSGSSLTEDDDGGNNTNFAIEQYLNAGTLYYYGVRYYSSSSTGSISVLLSE